MKNLNNYLLQTNKRINESIDHKLADVIVSGFEDICLRFNDINKVSKSDIKLLNIVCDCATEMTKGNIIFTVADDAFWDMVFDDVFAANYSKKEILMNADELMHQEFSTWDPRDLFDVTIVEEGHFTTSSIINAIESESYYVDDFYENCAENLKDYIEEIKDSKIKKVFEDAFKNFLSMQS